ncbi:MAG: peptidoglycan-associated lipoprotein Pal [Nitrospirota bacterium]
MKRTTVVVLMVILVLSVFTLYGCPKSADVSSAPESQPQKVEKTPAELAAEAAKAEEEKKAAEAAAAAAAAKAAEEEAAAKERAAKEAAGLKAIHFDFDKSFVRDDAKAIMKANAAWLKANPKAKVRIEGNCDERGTIEYNQALGQRRAASAKKYLTDLGISGKRISLISYGKEKPVCKEGTEDCWQQNRRADLVAAE